MGKERRDGFHKRGGIWHTTDPVTGKRATTGFRELKAAKAWKAHREIIAANPTNAAAETTTLADGCAAIIDYKSQDKSAATLLIYRQKLGHFIRIWGAELPLARIGPELGDSYTAQRRSEGVTDHTIVKEFSALGQMLKLAKRRRCYHGDISLLKPGNVIPRYTPRSRALTVAEFNALIGVCNERLYALVVRIVCLACRLSEARRFVPEDLDQTKWTVQIRGTKTKKSAVAIPVLKPFRSLLLSTLEAGPLAGYKNNVCRDIANACAKAGIARCTPNDLRRTHATLLVEQGVDTDTVRRMLRHTTSKMVEQIYAQPTAQAVGALADRRLDDLCLGPEHRLPFDQRLVSRLRPSESTVYSRATLDLLNAYRDVLERRAA